MILRNFEDLCFHVETEKRAINHQLLQNLLLVSQRQRQEKWIIEDRTTRVEEESTKKARTESAQRFSELLAVYGLTSGNVLRIQKK